MPSDIQSILDQITSYLPTTDTARIQEAYEFAKAAHEGQLRFSGEPYITHPVEAAKRLLTLQPDEDTIIACLLHDVVEDTDIDLLTIAKKFGKPVAQLCAGMEKLGTMHFQGQERQVENLRKMFVAMAADLRVIFIKLADRIHNMETLGSVRHDKQQRIAKETLAIYAPIAARLGIFNFKKQLEDLAFQYLEPVAYARVKREVAGTEKSRARFVKQAIRDVEQLLKENNVQGTVAGRTKHIYSIWKKMEKKGFDYVNEIYDLFAIRIFVETEADCYAMLGTIHQRYTPLAHRFKDFIAVPKVNGYQSLHTTIVGINPSGLPTEVQIRTHAMHAEAEHGAAAHWQYAEKKKSVRLNEQRLNWVKGLVDLHQRMEDNDEFVEALAIDTLSNRIFALTPNGMVLDLPVDATPVDFAYAVHTEIGHTTVGAKVNGKIAPLDSSLQNGDVVEILRKKENIPNRFWLSFIKSESTRSKIKSYFNALDHEENVAAGKELINTQLIRLGKSRLTNDYAILRTYKNRDLSLREREGMLERVGNGSVSAHTVIRDLFHIGEVATKHAPKNVAAQKKTDSKPSEVVIAGETQLPHNLAKCCKPQAGDPIMALMSPRKGATIHRMNCKMFAKANPDRRLTASWGASEAAELVSIIVESQNRIGLLRDIAATISGLRIDIVDIDMKKNNKHNIAHAINIEIHNISELASVLDKLERIEGVETARRMVPEKKERKKK